MGGVAEALHAAGVHALYGAPLAGVDVVPVSSPRVARLLAVAEERVSGWRAGVVDGSTITVPGRYGTDVGLADLEAPAADRWRPPGDDVVERLQAAVSPLVLVGPGVVLDGAIAGLQMLAAGADLGVLNTWGAKGLFDWRSRHHLATVGLQRDDADLGGVGDADLLLVSGLDRRESTPELWLQGDVVEVEPWALAPLAEVWSRPRRGVTMPPLRDRLGAATQSGWGHVGAPLMPSQATRNYGEIITAGGTVAADPGMAGYWVARTLGTTRPLAVHVTADADARGFAIACVTVARLRRPWAPALAVVDEVDDEALDVARSLGVEVGVEVWADDGDVLDADAHRDRLASLTTGGVARLRTSPDQLAAMLDAAGPITAWRRGPAPRTP